MSETPKLPREMLVVAWIALVLSVVVGMGSAMQTDLLIRIDEVEVAAVAGVLPDDQRAFEAMTRAQRQALESMRGPRIALLVVLSFTCGLTIISSARLIWPGPLPRQGMRRIAGGAAIASGILRTIDGAMITVVGQRTGDAVAKLTGPLQGVSLGSEWFKPLATTVIAGSMVVLTVLFAGAFVAVGQYLQSDRARRLLE